VRVGVGSGGVVDEVGVFGSTKGTGRRRVRKAMVGFSTSAFINGSNVTLCLLHVLFLAALVFSAMVRLRQQEFATAR
jgi:hypothetical protein